MHVSLNDTTQCHYMTAHMYSIIPYLSTKIKYDVLHFSKFPIVHNNIMNYNIQYPSYFTALTIIQYTMIHYSISNTSYLSTLILGSR